MSEIRINILFGIEQGMIDLDDPKDSIMHLLDIDERTFDSYFHFIDSERIIDDFFCLVDDIQLYFRR